MTHSSSLKLSRYLVGLKVSVSRERALEEAEWGEEEEAWKSELSTESKSSFST